MQAHLFQITSKCLIFTLTVNNPKSIFPIPPRQFTIYSPHVYIYIGILPRSVYAYINVVYTPLFAVYFSYSPSLFSPSTCSFRLRRAAGGWPQGRAWRTTPYLPRRDPGTEALRTKLLFGQAWREPYPSLHPAFVRTA